MFGNELVFGNELGNIVDELGNNCRWWRVESSGYWGKGGKREGDRNTGGSK